MLSFTEHKQGLYDSFYPEVVCSNYCSGATQWCKICRCGL